MSSSGKGNIDSFSLITITNNSSQLIPKAYFICGFEVVLIDLRIAIKESPKKITSNDFHQKGCDSCSIADPACAMNRNGVTKQCTRHKLLATIPKVSELLRMYDMFKMKRIYLDEQRYYYFINATLLR